MALTDKDIKSLKSLMRVTVEETARDLELVTKQDIKHLPNKVEFYEQTG